MKNNTGRPTTMMKIRMPDVKVEETNYLFVSKQHWYSADNILGKHYVKIYYDRFVYKTYEWIEVHLNDEFYALYRL